MKLFQGTNDIILEKDYQENDIKYVEGLKDAVFLGNAKCSYCGLIFRLMHKMTVSK